MNKALLTKWLIRFRDPKELGIWKANLLAKYANCRSTQSFSPFWKEVMLLKEVIDISINVKLGNGNSTSFWLDRWLGDCNLATLYPSLFEIAQDKAIKVSQVFSSTDLYLPFARQLVGVFLEE